MFPLVALEISVRNEDRHRVLMLRTNVNEVEVETIHLGKVLDLWVCVSPRNALMKCWSNRFVHDISMIPPFAKQI
jgi:hypothetical protein